MIFLAFNLFERINFYLLCAFYILLFPESVNPKGENVLKIE